MDCCDRERPSARRRTSQILSPQPKKALAYASAFFNEARLRCMERYGRFTFADGKRFITDYVAIAREIAAATGEFYFTFCVCKTLYAFIRNRFCGSFFVLSCIVKNPKNRLKTIRNNKNASQMQVKNLMGFEIKNETCTVQSAGLILSSYFIQQSHRQLLQRQLYR